jgi:CRP-like cAMP-binding protein
MAGTEHKVEALRTVPLFAGCTDAELERIAAIADELSLVQGKVLTREGDPGREMFLLLDGTVEVERSGEVVNHLGPGDFLGEGTLILGKPRNATITATSHVRALVITESNFRHLLEADEDIAKSVHDTLEARTPPDEDDAAQGL